MAEIRKRSRKSASLLKVSLRGSDIGRSGAVPIPLLIDICKALQSAISKQAELQVSDNLPAEEYTLELVRLGKGSTVLEFELARAQSRLVGQEGAGEKAVLSVVAIVHELEEGKKPALSESSSAVVSSLNAMAKVVGPNLRVALYVPRERTNTMESVTAIFNQKVAERVAALAAKEIQSIPQVIEGVVEMADFKPSDHRFRLVPLYGPAIVCGFDEEISADVHELTRCVARVSGIAEKDSRGKVVSFHVEQIVRRGSPFQGAFDQKKSIAQLIAQQNVKPIKTISELKGIWPEHEPKPN